MSNQTTPEPRDEPRSGSLDALFDNVAPDDLTDDGGNYLPENQAGYDLGFTHGEEGYTSHNLSRSDSAYWVVYEEGYAAGRALYLSNAEVSHT